MVDGDIQPVEGGEVDTLAGTYGEGISVTDAQSKEEHHTSSVDGQSMGQSMGMTEFISPDITTADITMTDTMHRIESATTMMIDGVAVLADIAEEEEEMAAAQIEKERVELVERIKEAIEERDRVHSLNSQVQNEIAEYLARKKVICYIVPCHNGHGEEMLWTCGCVM